MIGQKKWVAANLSVGQNRWVNLSKGSEIKFSGFVCFPQDARDKKGIFCKILIYRYWKRNKFYII